MLINKYFPVLSILSRFLFLFGVVIFLAGLFFGIPIVIDFIKLIITEGAEWHWEQKDIFGIISLISGVFFGLLTMAIAEIIGVLFAIENNTRNQGKNK